MVERLVGANVREFLVGDLEERFDEHRVRLGHARAVRWYWRQAALAVWQCSVGRQRGRHLAAATARGRDSMWRQLQNDLKFAGRLLARQRGYALIAVLSMALAIGANGLVFGLVDNLVFNPFQFPDAGRLISVGSAFPRLNVDEGFIEQHSPAEVDDFRRARSLVNVAAFDLGNRAVSNGERAERFFTALILDDPLPALGQPMTLGRSFAPDELASGGPAVAVLSHRLWQSLFDADPDIVGRAVAVNSVSRTVVGVLGPNTTLIGTDLWIPWGADTTNVPRNRRQFTVVGRLAPGASMAEANVELRTIAARTTEQFVEQFPEYQGWHLRATTWTEAVTGQSRGIATLLVGAGIFVLLIACANLTGLMLARLAARRRELSVRYALGAGGWQVTRLLLVESLAIAGTAAILGLIVAQAALGPVTTLLPQQVLGFASAPQVDLRVITYGGIVALGAALFITLIPAWQARQSAPHHGLRDGITTTVGRQWLRNTLVVAELTLAVVLLVGAGLLLRSYARIQQIDPGFRTDHMLTMRLTLAQERFGPDQTKVFFNELLERLRTLPEIAEAAAASQFPPQQPFTLQFQVEGVDAQTETLPTATFTMASVGLFETLGVPLRHGRTFGREDRDGAPVSVVVNEAFMNRFLDGQPMGRLLVANGTVTADIVGVVGNTRNDTLLRPPVPEVFVAIDQGPFNNQFFLLIRTTVDPEAALPVVQRALGEMDPDQPLYLIQTMDQALLAAVSPQRIGLFLVGTFAVAALLIAVIGVYGVVSFWVSTRTREIGIRLALGASARQITALVAGQTSRLILIGAVLGLAGGVLLGRTAASLLFETDAADPVALVGVAAVLGLVGVLAGIVPTRRALGVDPVQVLRSE